MKTVTIVAGIETEIETVFEVWAMARRDYPNGTWDQCIDPDDHKLLWRGEPADAFQVMMLWQADTRLDFVFEIREFIIVPPQWGESTPSKWQLLRTVDGVQYLVRFPWAELLHQSRAQSVPY